MTVITRSIPLVSRKLSRIYFSNSRPWPICINKCTKKAASWRQFTANSRQSSPLPWSNSRKKTKPTIRENIYTLPNLLTLSRMLSCPILGWSILDGNYYLSTGLLVYAGFTDWVGVFCRLEMFFTTDPYVSLCMKLDGFLARQYNMSSVLGTILDPAADKVLMTTLTVTLTMQELIPRKSRGF